MKILSWFLIPPLALLTIWLAVANRHRVTVNFDAFSAQDPAFALELPLILVMAAMLLIGVLIGGAAAWLKQGRWRRRARKQSRALDEIAKTAPQPATGTAVATTPPGVAPASIAPPRTI